MITNLIDMSKVDEFYKEIDDYIFKLENDLLKISELVDSLSVNFVDDKQMKIYSEISEKNMEIIKSDIHRLKKLNDVIKKMKSAYITMENDFSSKNII